MNDFQFAIASIVDTNTGYGLPKSKLDSGREISTTRTRHTALRTFVDYLQRIRSGITAARIVLRKRRKLKQGMRQLALLNDHMLEDIGLTRGDVIAAQNGEIDQAQLQTRRVRNRDIKLIATPRAAGISSKPVKGEAVNDAVFENRRCA